jgi:hypothetical protein
MNREVIKKTWVISLFWGALWGIVEATLGYLAHLVTVIPGIAGFIMFPIGFYFMTRAYRETGKLSALFNTAAVAAGIKLVDLFLPALNPIKTINPAAAILMEGLVLIVIYKVLQKSRRTFGFPGALLAASAWRVGFILYSALLLVFSIDDEFLSAVSISRFLLLESIINALIIAMYLKVEKSLERGRAWWFAGGSAVGPALSFTAFAAAVLVKFILVG